MKLFFLSVMFLCVLQFTAFTQVKNKFIIPTVSNPVIRMENLQQQWQSLTCPKVLLSPATLGSQQQSGCYVLHFLPYRSRLVLNPSKTEVLAQAVNVVEKRAK